MKNASQKKDFNSSWLRTFSIGFSIISIGIAIGVVGYILGTKKNQTVVQQTITTFPTIIQPSPTSIDETANLKMYIDNYWRISFKYPQTWDVKTYGYDQKSSMSIELSIKLSPIMSFVLTANPKNLSLQELDQENASKDKERGAGVNTPRLSINNYTSVIIGNGINAFYEKEYFCEPSVCERYIITPKNKVVEIIIFPRKDYQQSIDQILSTFQFTN